MQQRFGAANREQTHLSAETCENNIESSKGGRRQCDSRRAVLLPIALRLRVGDGEAETRPAAQQPEEMF